SDKACESDATEKPDSVLGHAHRIRHLDQNDCRDAAPNCVRHHSPSGHSRTICSYWPVVSFAIEQPSSDVAISIRPACLSMAVRKRAVSSALGSAQSTTAGAFTAEFLGSICLLRCPLFMGPLYPFRVGCQPETCRIRRRPGGSVTEVTLRLER